MIVWQLRWFEALVKGVVSAGAIAVIGTALRLHPDPSGMGTHLQLGMEPCNFLVVHGYPCITCGMTTSFAHMVHGHVIGAFRASPAGALLCLVTIATPPWLIHSFVKGLPAFRFLRFKYGGYILPGAALIVLLSWVYKINVER